MKKGLSAITFICMAMALLLMPGVCGAVHFDYQIFGNLLEHPAEYSGGGFTSGGTGVIEITVDDTGWPLDPTARWDYLWTNYFSGNYDNSVPGAFKWVGSFTGRFYVSLTSAPTGYVGWCMGTITPKITIWDSNENGIMDLSERYGNNLFDARLSKLCTDPSGGEMTCEWGYGSIASNYFSFKVPPAIDTLYNGCDLTMLPGCSSAAQPSTWSSIKSLYE
jgi:hypothetical protein